VTAVQLARPTPQTFDIDQVVRLAVDGRLRVPAFQRSFVWDADDVRKLFDSIWRGFPIGTLLLWKREAKAGTASFGPVQLEVEGSTEAFWVVDGQQRVSSLVGALIESAAGLDDRFDLCFDLRRARLVAGGKRARPNWWLPVRVSLESRTLLTWLRANGQDLSEEELDLADAFGGALRDYKIPAYVVEHDDEDLLREVFDRVNSAGKRISRAQVFHALFAGGTEPGSPASIVASLEHEGFGVLDAERVVQSLLAIRGGDVARDLHDEFEPNEDRAIWYDDSEAALSRAIRFLRSRGVQHLSLVPSTFPLPVLAAFYHLHPVPEPWHEELLARWMWRGWVHGFGRAGQTAALRQAVRAVNPRKGRRDEAPGEYFAVKALLAGVTDEPAKPLDTENFRTSFAASRLALLALASLDPVRLDGSPIDLAAEFEARGGEAVTQLVPGPRSRLGTRGFWPFGEPQPTGKEPNELLSSHAIDSTAAELLATGEITRFIEHRGTMVSELGQQFLNARLQPRAQVRPALTDLVVADDVDDEAG
jgi:hypothetical protein